MNKQLKVLFLPTANAGVVWHRMFQFFRYLRDDPELSMAMDKYDPNRTNPYPWIFKENDCLSLRVQIEKLVSQADVVVIEYVISDYALCIVQILKKELFKDKLFIAEIDDYCLELNPYAPAIETYRPGGEASSAIIDHLKISDRVIVSTDYLGKLYRDFNKNIKLIPNGIDFKIWDNLIEKKRKHKRIRIGWSGASTHSADIKFIYPVIIKVLEKYPNVEFFFQGGFPPFLQKQHDRLYTIVKWKNMYEYPQFFKDLQYDIGIAPLLDNNFNRAKSNLKWLEYSVLKIPTIASSVEPFKKSIIQGKTGFLCNELNEWEEAFDILIKDAQKRKEIGENAYREIKEKFNLELIARDYAKFLKESHYEFIGNKK